MSPNPLLARFAAHPQRFLPEAICCRRVPKIGDCTMGCTQVTMCFSAIHRAFCHSALVGTSSPSSVAHMSHLRSPVARWFGATDSMVQRPDPKGLLWSACTRQNGSSRSCQMHGRHCEDLGGGPSARPAPNLHSLLFRLLMLCLWSRLVQRRHPGLGSKPRRAISAPELKRNVDLRSPRLGPKLLLHLLARSAGFLLQDEHCLTLSVCLARSSTSFS